MLFKIEGENLSRFLMVGDKVLVKPKLTSNKTGGGLYLPPGVEEKRKIQSGYVIKIGPGYPIPSAIETDEPWKENADNLKYFSLQAKEGDLAVYLQDSVFEIEFNNEKYCIIPHAAILMLVRDPDLLGK